MKPKIPGWVIMLVRAVPGKRSSCFAVLVIGVYRFLAVIMENSEVHSLYSNRGIRTLLLIYRT